MQLSPSLQTISASQSFSVRPLATCLGRLISHFCRMQGYASKSVNPMKRPAGCVRSLEPHLTTPQQPHATNPIPSLPSTASIKLLEPGHNDHPHLLRQAPKRVPSRETRNIKMQAPSSSQRSVQRRSPVADPGPPPQVPGRTMSPMSGAQSRTSTSSAKITQNGSVNRRQNVRGGGERLAFLQTMRIWKKTAN